MWQNTCIFTHARLYLVTITNTSASKTVSNVYALLWTALFLTNSSVTHKICIIARNLRLLVTAPLSFGADIIVHTPEDRQLKRKDTNTEHVHNQIVDTHSTTLNVALKQCYALTCYTVMLSCAKKSLVLCACMCLFHSAFLCCFLFLLLIFGEIRYSVIWLTLGLP